MKLLSRRDGTFSGDRSYLKVFRKTVNMFGTVQNNLLYKLLDGTGSDSYR